MENRKNYATELISPNIHTKGLVCSAKGTYSVCSFVSLSNKSALMAVKAL